jgi:hypothetical protein
MPRSRPAPLTRMTTEDQNPSRTPGVREGMTGGGDGSREINPEGD